ncbi:MAG: glycosyltransferase family 39 protein [Syntrophobacterales bacterium]|nr:glycosyltransferase family 39 protein [Syntrophobacterales bacterium]
MYDPVTAFSASILYLSSPLILFHARTVSLEIPSVSLCLMATFYFYRYATHGRPRDGLLLAIATSLALLTKQTSVYLLLFYAAFSLYQYYSKGTLIFSWKSAALYLSIIAIIILPSYGLSFYFHSSVIAQDSFKGIQHYLDYNNYVYYILNLHKQLSVTAIVLLCASLVSFLLPPRKPLTDQDLFLLAWAASCYLLFTVLGSKEPRYIIYWVPSLCAVAALPVTRGAAGLASRVAGLSQARGTGLLVILLTLAALSEAMAAPRSYISGYEAVSRYLLSQVPRGQKEIVFYDGDFPSYGAITFAARKADPERRIFFFRSSKFLFATAIFPSYAFWQIRNDEKDIKDFFKKYGIRFILINFLAQPEEENISVIQVLRDMLQHDPDFRLVKKFPIVYQMDHGGEIYSRQGDLLLYTYLQAPPLPANLDLEIPMPSIGKTITIRLP